MEKIKSFIAEYELVDKLQAAAFITTLLAAAYYIAWAVHWALTGLVTFIGLSWPIRIWIAGSAVYIIYATIIEYKAYCADPNEYWPIAEEEEEDEHIGV